MMNKGRQINFGSVNIETHKAKYVGDLYKIHMKVMGEDSYKCV